MTRSALTVQQLVNTGLAPSYGAFDAAGMYFVNDGNVMLHIKNSGTIKALTIATPAKVAGLDIAEDIVSIPATTGDKMIGPFDPSVFNQDAGVVYIDVDSATGVTVAAVRTR